MTLDNEKPDGTGIMSMDDAIRIIQSHERARQGRLRAKQIRELRLNDQRARQRANMGESKMDKVLAATIIQKYYRRHVVRREAKKFRDEEYMFLGMVCLSNIICTNLYFVLYSLYKSVCFNQDGGSSNYMIIRLNTKKTRTTRKFLTFISNK